MPNKDHLYATLKFFNNDTDTSDVYKLLAYSIYKTRKIEAIKKSGDKLETRDIHGISDALLSEAQINSYNSEASELINSIVEGYVLEKKNELIKKIFKNRVSLLISNTWNFLAKHGTS